MRFTILIMLLCLIFSGNVFAEFDAGITTLGDVVGELGDVIDTVKGHENVSANSGKLIALMSLLAVVFKFLISFLKFSSVWFKSNKGKNIIKIITLLLGVGTFFVSNMALGVSWWDSFVLALSGPMSMAIHEITKILPSIRDKK